MLLLVWLSVLYPLWHAWRVNRQTTLRPALAWATAAWASWVVLVWGNEGGWGGGSFGGGFAPPKMPPCESLGRYLALSLTCCAGVAVLGARRPGVGAWNFVVVGLLAVLLLPVAQGLGQPRLHTVHLLFLGLALGVIVLNYLPTRFGLSAGLLAFGWAVEFIPLTYPELPEQPVHPAWMITAGRFSQAGAPGWLCSSAAWAARPTPSIGPGCSSVTGLGSSGACGSWNRSTAPWPMRAGAWN